MTVVNLHLDCHYLEAREHGGTRKLAPKYVVIHSTESPNRPGSAKDVASFFARGGNPDNPASTTITVDDTECYRSLTDEVIPWAAPPFNSRGLHIEQCGFAKWTRAEWFKHKPTIDKAAQAAAYWAMAYDIPVRFLTPGGCKANRAGITCHRNVSLAFGLSDHSDPGPTDNKHYPYDYFIQRVKTIVASV